MRPVKAIKTLAILALAAFILPVFVPTFILPPARAHVSYNPSPADILHAPLSNMGFLAFTEATGNSSQLTTSPGVSFPSPSANNKGPDAIRQNALRFINDTSYFPQTETSIAVDPTNTDHVVGGFNDQKFFFCRALQSECFLTGFSVTASGFTVSADGGASVLKGGDIPVLNSSISLVPMFAFGDPTVVSGGNGVFFYSSLSVSIFGANGVMVARSNPNLFDPNVSCTTPIFSPTANPCWTAILIFGNPDFSVNMEDKPVMVFDQGNDPYSGSLYIGWTHFSFIFGTSVSYLARCNSALDSCTMLAGGTLPPLSGNDRFADFTTPAVDAKGNVYVSWCDYGTVSTFGPVTCKVRSSPPGGASFGSTTTILSFMGAGTTLPTDTFTQAFATEQFRTSSLPYFSVDKSQQSTSGNLYFTIQVCTSGRYVVIHNRGFAQDNPGTCGLSSILFSSSGDGGSTWSWPAVISQQAVNVQPTITVDPVTGNLFVLYYTTQFDPFNHRIDVVALKSMNGGSSFRQIRVSSASNEPDSDPNMFNYINGFGGSWTVPQYGDYFQATSIGGTLWVLFTANYAVEQGTFQTDPFLSVQHA